MNAIWCGMIFIGIIFAAINGRLDVVTQTIIKSSKEAMELCFSMAGVMAFWTGIMKIAEKAGLVDILAKRFHPIIHFLFPRLPEKTKAERYLTVNFLSNILGLGWAATPAGILAMKELDLEEKKRKTKMGISTESDRASQEMCTFLILNVSSLQLIPMNVIAYRSQYGSINPTVIAGPAIVATIVSTITAVIFCKIFNNKKW